MTNSNTPLVSRRIPIAIVIGLTLFSGIVHGYLDGRWWLGRDLSSAGQKLNELPNRCGDWVLVGKSELDESAAELLRCYGSTVREYRNEEMDASVNVAILFGPRGPVAVHTPEVCYSSIGTQQTRSRQKETIRAGKSSHELWSVQFARNPDPDPSLEVWYAWTDGGHWQAAEYPRFWMTDSLYKIQVAGPVANQSVQPCREFLEQFLPQLEEFVN